VKKAGPTTASWEVDMPLVEGCALVKVELQVREGRRNAWMAIE
jgi:hypothetical protein